MQRRLSAIVLSTLALAAAMPAWAGPHAHAPAAHATAPQLAFDESGRKWATDEPLRAHMWAVRNALYEHREAIASDRLADGDARRLGEELERRAAAIVTECRLEPAADANLHIVIADLLAAADVLQGKAKTQPARGAGKAMRAAHMYAVYFEHPGWKPVYPGSGRAPTLPK